MDNQIIIAIISSLGIGTFIGALTTFFLGKNKEVLFAQIEQRQKRYKCALIYMQVILNPTKINWLHYEYKNITEVFEGLRSEYTEMLLYSGKNVILAVKNFIENPNEKNLLKVTIEMRKDLWNKKTDLKLNEIQLSLESK